MTRVLVILAALVALASPASAATVKPAVVLDPIQNLMNQIEGVDAKVVADVVTDIMAADADASATDPNTGQMRDQIAHACYPAAIKFLQTLPQATPFTGKLTGVQLFQRKRDFVAQIKAGLPIYLKLGCSPLIGDEIQILIQMLAMVGVKIVPAALTGIFPALAPVTLPIMSLVP